MQVFVRAKICPDSRERGLGLICKVANSHYEGGGEGNPAGDITLVQSAFLFSNLLLLLSTLIFLFSFN